jgi:hypothetical protein
METKTRYATPLQCRLMDEAYRRAVALGRPFYEHEAFQFAWEQGHELYPGLDTERFQLYREAYWRGKGDNAEFIPRLWVVRTPTDETAHVEDSLRSGELSIPELEATIVSRRLSVRASAQVNRESGELEVGTKENGLEVYSAEEALELLELLNQERDTLYALAHEGERA